LIAINNMPDHFHILVGLQPTMAVSQLVAAVKASSSGFINDNRWVLGRFDWQEGFGAFSYSHSQVPTVARYIERQEQHHSRKTFQEEYLKLLNRFGVAHDQRYIFRPIE
jgi:REP element-mobilizing transposase RayT